MCSGMDQFIGKGRFLATAIIFLEYGLAIASSTYCLTFFFLDHTVAQVEEKSPSQLCIKTNSINHHYISKYCLIFCAECGFVGPLLHWTYSYGYFIHYGAY